MRLCLYMSISDWQSPGKAGVFCRLIKGRCDWCSAQVRFDGIPSGVYLANEPETWTASNQQVNCSRLEIGIACHNNNFEVLSGLACIYSSHLFIMAGPRPKPSTFYCNAFNCTVVQRCQEQMQKKSWPSRGQALIYEENWTVYRVEISIATIESQTNGMTSTVRKARCLFSSRMALCCSVSRAYIRGLRGRPLHLQLIFYS